MLVLHGFWSTSNGLCLWSEQASLYQSVVDEMLVKIENSEGIERRGNVLAAMAKLKQVCTIRRNCCTTAHPSALGRAR